MDQADAMQMPEPRGNNCDDGPELFGTEAPIGAATLSAVGQQRR
jgi:hypothetical protein